MIRVIKLGGSLLSMPDLLPVLDTWIRRQPSATSALVVGGGTWVQAIRDVQPHLRLNDHDAHWLAMEAMGLTARLISTSSFRSLPGGYPIVSHRDALVPGGVSVLDVAEMVRVAKPSLPESWSVTSDSLAAWAARTLAAGELVLLKSRDAHENDTDLVDAYFSEAAEGLPCIRVVNLRSFR